MAWGDLAAESQSLSPLGSDLRSGLTAIAVLAFISFFAATTLFAYLVYKVATWHLFIRNQPNGHIHEHTGSIQRAIDFTLGIDGILEDSNPGDNKNVWNQDEDGTEAVASPKRTKTQRRQRQPNQFLILIINLLLADMHQGVAFFLNAEWLRKDAIAVGTPTCFAQGLFVSLGDLSSSMFITAIAVHTYISVVARRKTPQKVLYCVIAAIWVFVYVISFVPIGATKNGAEYGGFFVRAGSWVINNHSCSE